MANEFNVTGKVIHVLPLQEGDSRRRPGEKWQKQDYVIETIEEWPKKICFNIWGEDRIRQANIQPGEVINLSFTVESREYNGRWYTDVRGQFVSKGDPAAAGYAQPNYGQSAPQSGFQGGAGFGTQPQQHAPQSPNGGAGFGGEQGGQDDLPF